MRRGGRHRKDSNHDVVVEAIERLGYWWWDASQSDIGCDGFAVGYGRLIPIEIKDRSTNPRLVLTDNEERVQRRLRRHQVHVEIVTGDDDSLDVLRGHARRALSNFYDPARNR